MIKGQYIVDHYRRGRLLDRHVINNAIVYDGLNAIINAFIFGTYTSLNWFFGLMDATNSSNNGVITDTMASHPSWQELQVYEPVSDTITVGTDTNVPISGRPRWPYVLPIITPAISNTTNITLPITFEGVMNGIFLCSDYTLGGITGTLFSTGLSPNTIYLYPDDQLVISYTLRSRTSPGFVSDQRM
jgi:hypothetical protein